MQRNILTRFVLALCVLAVAAAPQGPRSRGLKVTYSPLAPAQRAKEGAHSYRADLLSLAVERGETPTPMISPGMFQAEFEGVLPLPVRDRYRFRIEGRGKVELKIDGDVVLAGNLRPGKPLDTERRVRLAKGDNRVSLRLESTGTGEARVRLHWASSEFAFEPIPPERWEWDVDDPDIARGEQLRFGHQLFVERRCAQCHETGGQLPSSAYSELEQPAPDLRDAGARLHQGWLAEWLRDPRAVLPEARMPRFAAEQASDYDDLAAWLATLGQPLDPPEFPDDAAARGAARFRELGCIACHIPPGESVDPEVRFDRIALDFVPRKWRPTALLQYLKEPRAGRSHSRMPAFRLDLGDVTALAAYLLQDAAPPAARPGDAERGRRLAQRHGCNRCHVLPPVDQGGRYREIGALHVDHGCLAGDDKAPDFGLDAEQTAALAAFLPRADEATQRRAPLDYAARMVPALRCTNCHGHAAEPSVWAQVAEWLAEQEPLPPEQDPIAQGIPALTWAGAKLQPSWMRRFVQGEGVSPRPWLQAQMPGFPAHGGVVVDGLLRAHGYSSEDEPRHAPDVRLAGLGATLVKMGQGFGCVQCHGVGDQPPIQVFERQGVNFDVAAERLRKEYYLRWLLDPLRIDASARMPKYADARGRTAFTGILDGDAARQFDAIWHWFRTLR